MKKQFWILIILGIIIVALAGVLLWPKSKPVNENQQQKVEGIQVTAPKENGTISSPLKITGTTNGGGWNGFEGQVGTVKLLDSKGKQLGQTAILTAVTDWTKPPVNFEANLNFISTEEQNGTLVFSNENPSGLPDKDKQFAVPVKVKASAETITVKVYFQDPVASNTDCKAVKVAERTVSKTEAVARVALEQLLLGPTSEERQIYMTSINSGVKIQSLKIENGTAYADFDEILEKNVGGSCKVTAIRAQITQTLKQFPTINEVIISINGDTETILQP